MEEQNNRSFEAQKEPNQSSKPSNIEKVDDCKEKVKKTDEQRQLICNTSSDCTAENVSAGKRGISKTSQPDALTSVPLPANGSQFEESSHLSEVPVEYSLQPLQSVEELKDQVRAIPAESVQCITGQPTQVQVHQLQVPDGPSRLGLRSTSVTQSLSFVTNTTLSEQKSQTVINGNKPCLVEEDKQNSPSPKPLHVVPTLKTPSDGYNWRKYGQKQVKNPEGSRSYFRCTFSECCAKKIECCDPSNRVIETVYRSHHNHEPPEKLNSNRETRPELKGVPVNGSSDTIHPVRGLNDLVPHIFSKEHLKELDQTLETKRQESNDSDETMETNDEYVDGPEYKKRQKRSFTSELGSIPKPGNKPKIVVHAAGDVGISGDGYRWRKYGQKMVKGNPHPRNYYRCTSAGCPVRKHIERALDNTCVVLITYKGRHDHDKPVPKKRYGPKNTPLVSATSPLVNKLQIDKTDAHHSQTQYSVYKEDE